MRLRIYLDTSVFSAYYDDRVKDRQVETQEFWARLGSYEVGASELTREELEQTPDTNQRKKLIELLQGIHLHGVTSQMKELAEGYVRCGAFTLVMYADAVHVACAVLTRQDILVSWNFKHLVNRRRRAMINEWNALKGYPLIEIVAPPEI